MLPFFLVQGEVVVVVEVSIVSVCNISVSTVGMNRDDSQMKVISARTVLKNLLKKDKSNR